MDARLTPITPADIEVLKTHIKHLDAANAAHFGEYLVDGISMEMFAGMASSLVYAISEAATIAAVEMISQASSPEQVEEIYALQTELHAACSMYVYSYQRMHEHLQANMASKGN